MHIILFDVGDIYKRSYMQERDAIPDDADTQPLSDGQPQCTPPPQASPGIDSQWRLERGKSTSHLGDLGEKFEEAADVPNHDDEYGEAQEEEVVTDDDCVEPVVCMQYQDNDTVLIMSDDECVMSPQKPKAPELEDLGQKGGADQHGGSTGNATVAAAAASTPQHPQQVKAECPPDDTQVAGQTGSSDPALPEALVAPVPPGTKEEIAEAAAAEAEQEALDSEKEETAQNSTQAKKQTFKARSGTFIN